jgi:hypothetical protein
MDKEEAKLFIGDKVEQLSEKDIIKLVEKIREGLDAPMTAEIYGKNPEFNTDGIKSLPEATDQIQGELDPLQRFINMYQPSELIMRINFRKHLFEVLEDWRKKSPDSAGEKSQAKKAQAPKDHLKAL